MGKIPKFKVDYYYDYEELKDELKTLAEAAPELCRLHSIGTTHEGRDIFLMEVTDFGVGVPEKKPGYYAEACTHAEEFCGTNMAVNLIWYLLDSYGEKEDIKALLRDVVFYIVPRVNPDGVDTVMKTGIPGVSNGKYPLDERQPLPGLYTADLNGDHIVSQMRVPDPDGEWKISEKDPRLMVLRKPYENEGQFYRLYPEGLIRGDATGFAIPMPNDVNLNRNYPTCWTPEGQQYGACELPLCEPETRAIAYFIIGHPNIGGTMSFHTNAGAILRPFGSKSDDSYLGADLAMYKALGAMGTEELGYKLISTYGGFTPDKSRVRGGTLDDWTFETMGIPSFVLELWNAYDAAGAKRPENFHFSPANEDRDLAVLQWADREIGPSAYLEWEPVEHPQLGRVEVGGWNRVWVERNPPVKFLPDFAEKATAFTVKLAKTLPKLTLKDASITPLSGEYYKVAVTVKNTGYLPTYLTTQAKAVKTAQTVKLVLTAEKGEFTTECCSFRDDDIGHLEGRLGRDAEWSHDRDMWEPTERRAEWVIRSSSGELTLKLTASSPRCGEACKTLTL